jgi:hypothetical protein
MGLDEISLGNIVGRQASRLINLVSNVPDLKMSEPNTNLGKFNLQGVYFHLI